MSLVTDVLRCIDGSEWEIEKLRNKISAMEQENERLRTALKMEEGLQDRYQSLVYSNNRCQKRIKVLECDNAALKRRILELEQRLASCEGVDVSASADNVSENSIEAEKTALMELRLEDMSLERKTLSCLLYKGFETAGDVCKYRASELLNCVRGLGRYRLNDLNYRLGVLGLELTEEKWTHKRKIQRILAPSRAKLMKLEDLDLPDEVYDAAKAAGFEWIDDFMRLDTEEAVKARFENPEYAEKFLTIAWNNGFCLKKS